MVVLGVVLATWAPSADARAPTVEADTTVPTIVQLGMDGTVTTTEDQFVGDLRDNDLGARSVAITAKPGGYWIASSDGIVSVFGSAAFVGDLRAVPLQGEIVDIATTPTGDGYYLLGSDGGVFAFGDAVFHGSGSALDLVAAAASIAVTESGDGYWVAAADGGVFAYGDAMFHGSVPGALPPGSALVAPVSSISPTPTGNGYLLGANDGGVFAFGDAAFHGSAVELLSSRASVQVTTEMVGDNAYLVADRDGVVYGFNVEIGNLAGRPDTIDLALVD